MEPGTTSPSVNMDLTASYEQWLVLDPRAEVVPLGREKCSIRAGLTEHVHNFCALELNRLLAPLRQSPVLAELMFIHAEQVRPRQGAVALERLISIGLIERSHYAPVSKIYARVARGRLRLPLGIAPLESSSPFPEFRQKLVRQLPLSECEEDRSLWRRPTVRRFTPLTLNDESISRLLAASYGFFWGDDPARAKRSSPSAGGVYPLLLLVRLRGEEAFLQYQPETNALLSTPICLPQSALDEVCGAEGIDDAAALVICLGEIERIAMKYFEKAYRFACLDAGHALDRLICGAERLALGAYPLGNFDDDWLAEQISGFEPLYAIAIGKPA